MRDLAMFRAEVVYRAADGLLEAVLGGPIPFDAAYGQPFFDYLAQPTRYLCPDTIATTGGNGCSTQVTQGLNLTAVDG